MTPGEKPPIDEATWRSRFIMINLTRIGGTLIVLIGLLAWHSDWIRDGGAPIGFPVALVGLLVSFVLPRWLAHKWRTPPGP